MVVVGKHSAFLLVVVEWLKSKSTELPRFEFLLPKPNVNQDIKLPDTGLPPAPKAVSEALARGEPRLGSAGSGGRLTRWLVCARPVGSSGSGLKCGCG